MGMKSAYAVRTSGLSQATQVAVLEALAVFKNEKTGLCFPSTEKIATVARVSVKYVRKSLRELEEAGLISSKQKAGGVRYFTLHLEKLPSSPVFSDETNVTPDDESHLHDKCHPREKCHDTPEQMSPPPRDKCSVAPVTNVTPIMEGIKEFNPEVIRKITPTTPELALTPEVEKPKAKPKRTKTETDRPDDVDAQVWDEFLILRKQKKKTFTDLALQGMRREAEAAGLSLEAAMTICVENGWTGFKEKYVRESQPFSSTRPPQRPSNRPLSREQMAWTDDF